MAKGDRLRPVGPGGAKRRPSQLEELRALLLQDERARLARVEDRAVEPEDIAKVLPEAILRREGQDDSVARALEPAIEAGLFSSARKDPQVLADAIHPALGPAIRSMIQSSLRQSLESLNVALENALSPRGVQWRLEAARTGKSFSEVVLLKTLVFRVEHVLLVHRETGLVACEAVAPEAASRDGDLLAGMLSAIRDFASDSLGAAVEDDLQEVELGGLTMIVAQGPLANLALVVRGNPPRTLHERARDTLDAIHIGHGDDLARFDGETSPFAVIEPRLEELLEREAKQSKPNPWIRLIPVIAAAGVLLWILFASWQGVRARREVRSLETAFQATPGLVVHGIERRDDQIHVAGLLDPLAGDPGAVAAAATGRERADFVFNMRPFASLDTPILLARARRMLNLPRTVALRLDQGVLTLEGLEPSDPRTAIFLDRAPMIPGIERAVCRP